MKHKHAAERLLEEVPTSPETALELLERISITLAEIEDSYNKERPTKYLSRTDPARLRRSAIKKSLKSLLNKAAEVSKMTPYNNDDHDERVADSVTISTSLLVLICRTARKARTELLATSLEKVPLLRIQAEVSQVLKNVNNGKEENL